jgi:hypothetical protein
MLKKLFTSISEKIAERQARNVMKEFIHSAEGRHVIFKKPDGQVIWEYRRDEEGMPKVYPGSAYGEPTDDAEILFLEKTGEIYKDPETEKKARFSDSDHRQERK